MKYTDVTPAMCDNWKMQVADWRNGTSEGIAYTILSGLIAAAPDGKAQQALSKAYNDARANNVELEWATNVLADGIKYGNWPWIDFTNG